MAFSAAAARPADVASVSIHLTAVVIQSMSRFSPPLLSLIWRFRPSHAEDRLFSDPSRLSAIVSAIFFAAPSQLFNSLRRLMTLSVPDRNVLNAATLLLSVSSRASPRSMPLSFSLFSPLISVSRFVTGSPNAFARFPLASARLRMIFLVAVAALEASKPALANCPSNANTSSISKPKALATGATVDNALFR